MRKLCLVIAITVVVLVSCTTKVVEKVLWIFGTVIRQDSETFNVVLLAGDPTPNIS